MAAMQAEGALFDVVILDPAGVYPAQEGAEKRHCRVSTHQ
jgi:hypothetical protein